MSTDKRTGRKLIRGQRSTTVNERVSYGLDDAFELFYNVKKAEGMRERTLADYKAHWRYFRAWVDDNYPGVKINDITPSIAREYYIYMADGRTKYEGVEGREIEGQALSPTTVAIRLRTLRTMFNFWARERMIDINPVANLKPPKEDEDEIEAFTDDQLRLLLAAPDTRTFAGFRDKTLMMLLADTGLRINEALALTAEHIDVKARCIHLPAAMNKNRKPRIVPVSHEVLRLLFELMTENKTFFPDAEHIFLTAYGEPLTGDTVRKRLTRYGKQAGIDGQVRVSPHTFRHYFCKTYLLNGGDLFTLQRIVGHADISTTRKYVQMDDENIRAQHAQFSPIMRLRAGKRR
ncbi:tyrosine-type recombinase/integrase [Brevibacillus sp. WF146]|uniref:tyrosine-type recombinase/integrase n=1 Tax=Brevibacillus sp. WF146 TaxID=319501 RepID=UPI0007ECC7C1|nr:tyrosine-type recombinase/integrase [Brevibacillus sp. WF146]UYZ12194.1 tyrosine-type recombinase/integrase [Brevibacillus sp. WF146]UYZ13443.1 tyrosine-type recombinase/integrase [Brevibacillus sp. WF146]